MLANFLPIILMIVIFYFLLIRPQQKQVKEKQAMLNDIKAGDHIVTIGGLHGIVDEVNHTSGTVVLDCEGIYLTYSLNAVATVTVGGNIAERQAEVEEVNEAITEAEQENE